MILIVCKCRRSGGVCVCSQLLLKVKSSASLTHMNTHRFVYTNTHRDTGPLSGLPVIHDCSTHWAVLGCVSVSGSHPTGMPVCLHTQLCATVKLLCLCMSAEVLREAKKWKKTGGKKRGGGIKAERWQTGSRERH